MNSQNQNHIHERSLYRAEGMEVIARNLSFTRDEKFYSIFNEIAENSKEQGKLWRMHVFLWSFINGLKLEGDLIECGVWRGFCSSIATRYTDFEQNDKTLYLFDTWDGIPEDQIDIKRLGVGSKFNSINDRYKGPENYEKVLQRFKSFPNVKIIKGRVPDIFKEIKMPNKISFLHIDMNSSIAEIAALEVLFEKMVRGSICLLDDYGSDNAIHQMKAELDWFTKRGYFVCELPTMQGLVIKTD